MPSSPDFKNLKETQMFWLQQNLLQDYKEEKAAFKSNKKDNMKSMSKEEDTENEEISNEDFVDMMGERHKMGKNK